MRSTCTLIALRSLKEFNKKPIVLCTAIRGSVSVGGSVNIILVSDGSSRTRSLTIRAPQIAFAAAALIASVICLAVALHYFTLRYALANEAPYLRTLLIHLQAQQNARVQSYLRDSLNTMASTLGDLQARMVRLDALGDRLTKVAGLKPQEFMFDQLPARGGPESNIPGEQLSLGQLGQELDRLTRKLEDRTDKLRYLESALTEEHAKQQLVPTRSPIQGYYSSTYGWRIDPFNGHNAFHEGIDFVAQQGTAITAAAGGAVIYAAAHPQYGNMVEIDHGNDLVTRYAHASRILVRVGDVVLRGTKIAEVGNTGRSTGSHLHFEVRHRGVAQNPTRFLRRPG
jgi:murein DD-endopeptidase MepM/ murein hydrolase activator NlpD